MYIFLPDEICMHLTHCMYILTYILTYILLSASLLPLTTSYITTYHFFFLLHFLLHFTSYFTSLPTSLHFLLHAAHYPRIFPIQKTAAVQLQECKYFSNIFPSNFSLLTHSRDSNLAVKLHQQPLIRANSRVNRTSSHRQAYDSVPRKFGSRPAAL